MRRYEYGIRCIDYDLMFKVVVGKISSLSLRKHWTLGSRKVVKKNLSNRAIIQPEILVAIARKRKLHTFFLLFQEYPFLKDFELPSLKQIVKKVFSSLI